uniref:Uncharacterized protein n=1 Tax=Arundo donax TaxID=35708 RepID=A0A0A8Y6V8_ARUDO
MRRGPGCCISPRRDSVLDKDVITITYDHHPKPCYTGHNNLAHQRN